MKRDRTSGSGLIKTVFYIWNGYSRCVDRFESIFMQSSIAKLSKVSADILSACLEGSFLVRMSEPSYGCVYSGSALIGGIKRSFCRAESLAGSYYEGSGFKRIAAQIDAMEDNSKIIGILRRCSRKK